eukprot:m.89700 g.89700  ORF g.89700 m.89700 type:complete len:75 (+) comp12902_c0_seq6:2571-2795(+)
MCPAFFLAIRFPCARTSPLDIFREGDFDYPYNLKLLDRVAASIYLFDVVPFFADLAADANCHATAFYNPMQDGE